MYLEVITESQHQVVDHSRSGIRSNSETTFLVHNLNRLITLYMYVLYVHMYVCMYIIVCIYVCMHAICMNVVCMYVCMYVCIYM